MSAGEEEVVRVRVRFQLEPGEPLAVAVKGLPADMVAAWPRPGRAMALAWWTLDAVLEGAAGDVPPDIRAVAEAAHAAIGLDAGNRVREAAEREGGTP